MSMKDISWGSMIAGAAAVTVIAAVALTPAGFLGMSLAGTALAANEGATLIGAAVVGGTLGNMVSKLFHRAQDATTTLVGR